MERPKGAVTSAVSGAANDRGVQSQHGKGQDMAEGLAKDGSSGYIWRSFFIRHGTVAVQYRFGKMRPYLAYSYTSSMHAPCPNFFAAAAG